MKTLSNEPTGSASSAQPVTQLLAATSQAQPEQPHALARARAFAEPLLASETLDTGENTLAHADAVAAILKTIGGSEAMQAASYLVYACDHLNKPQEVIAKAFGDNFAALAVETTKLVRVQRQARQAQVASERAATGIPLAQTAAAQTENVRKMLLAFSRDLRVVMLRLASRLQTLRFFVAARQDAPAGVAREALQVFAPLANRLGIWEIKWEMEDLGFRFLEPNTYHEVASLLDEKRSERELHIEQLRLQLESDLKAQGMHATVQGRPKHIYSIVKKMRGKSLNFDQVYDIRALRVVVDSIADCYTALSWVHSQFTPISEEFDDYIAKPKANGYQSLHTVVRDSVGLPIEIQIRTQAMHDHAEHGVAAHWAYKEAGVKGYAGVSASSAYDAKIAVLRQLLAWERDLSGTAAQDVGLDERVYVLTPDATIVELPQGATAVDFAYSLHTDLGHRCRGARIDGVMVPLNTPLKNGQTVEVTVAKEGGPSRDWLMAEQGYLVSHRARSKVRAWFNALALHETVAKGREAVEKLLQREGKTALKLQDLAAQLGFNSADNLFEVVGKDEFSLRNIETLLHPPEPEPADEEPLLRKPRSAANPSKGGLLVVGVDSLMTQLAKCCKPAPPDPICGFVTRGKGVSVHRFDCSNLREMIAQNGERVIEVEWGQAPAAATGSSGSAVYPVDVAVHAIDRQGLLRDISEVFTKEKMNVVGVQTQSIKGIAWMTFTVEVSDAGRLHKVLGVVAELSGVKSARRR
ncbi:MAG: bifunctional (p)ppGpp synthetase/guanosine-3',5'-bis(diphosphate) 3'-pyrophosphohydrolase [Gammaproteobacteria bacterium]|uniref:RelA/SpoT family protein n=1 Tax=Rhodoferax sp. TaxID=50421 RepID=UPI00179D10F6|nr:bifunctional (p)ppGpp synthetase/guanosine-3',5'-bis(diphosphate) 3'-pyrophosphohydrolase [Rhodoferax sp.]MBU3899108.1 bifunctional (p)ppGpp synthetase/guanosine-3',5'-bis(diphosphate) 3'-pyrophosphohydrolase [Gammaproteobacteria bacterium]MBA3057592.1 bifunctional (p)ppGpp synthetase/guanosine-3',5'-bis(diphosphate) 3'-pyrophosphohydrolase [Rhodoferax sp.]MBU3997668.1 bifunctional (p)ppGpp synthetase/guanosine-3',5'-bis(diphosphate) 3'-pyrophosphohydrolase [Gammaproteobacteria bacterium]MBU